MQFHTLTRHTPRKKPKLVGRGGTRGKTSGRGTKGQNARAGRKKRPELRDFIKRVPKLRGRGKHSLKSRKGKLAGEALKAHLAEKA
jgi:large subunit ribosomal protein L15